MTSKVFNKISLLCLLFCCGLNTAVAQDWFQIHANYEGGKWAFPFRTDHVTYFDFDIYHSLQIHRDNTSELIVPFVTEDEGYQAVADSLTLSYDLMDWGKNKQKVFGIYITTDNPSEWTDQKVEAKEWVNCYISVDGRKEYPDLSISGKIRGRGNSTLKWYEKKPYRIKFDSSNKLLGINKNRDWVLLANWRDVTKVMNTFCFEAAELMGLPFTTPIRYAELFINGEYRGLYQIAEQVEVGGNRVDIDEEGGLLMTFDVDDGPSYDPTGTQNFNSKVYGMPVAIKSPKNLTKVQVDSVRNELATLENAIKAYSYDVVDSLLDLPSYIAMIQLQELVYNVELSAPRSVFFFRDKGGKWTFGPAWDWDAGFDFSWSDMYTGHTYFGNYRKSLLGSDPYKRNGEYKVPRFFTDMFGSRRFVSQYKEQWEIYRDTLLTTAWAKTQKFLNGINEKQTYKNKNGKMQRTSPMMRETERWPVPGFVHATEVEKMKAWLDGRMTYLNPLIEGFPEGNDDSGSPSVTPTGYTVVGTIDQAYTMVWSSGYSQNVKVKVSKSEVASLLSVNASMLSSANLDLVPLNSDGSEGTNTAAGTYGAWFDDEGNTTNFNSGFPYVYLESDDLFTWACGCHPSNSQSGEVHPVTMQYRYATANGEGKAVNVKVTFTINGGWFW